MYSEKKFSVFFMDFFQLYAVYTRDRTRTYITVFFWNRGYGVSWKVYLAMSYSMEESDQ